MGSAKDIVVKPITAKAAEQVVKRVHYSGKVAAISQLHLGVFFNGRLEGAMQFGPPIDRRKLLPLVEGTKFNNFLELNRMAFSDVLPRNSESRALGVAMRLIKKAYPHIEWIVSFADGTQCGDGTIYRASGFVLTQIKKNTTIKRLRSGKVGQFLSELRDAMMIGNHDNSDLQTDYFDVGWYININAGQWNKPYIHAPKGA